MTRMLITLFVGLSATGLSTMASLGTDASDSCIAQYLAIGGPDAQVSGYAQAGTLALLRDAGRTVWRCLACSDGPVGGIERPVRR